MEFHTVALPSFSQAQGFRKVSQERRTVKSRFLLTIGSICVAWRLLTFSWTNGDPFKIVQWLGIGDLGIISVQNGVTWDEGYKIFANDKRRMEYLRVLEFPTFEKASTFAASINPPPAISLEAFEYILSKIHPGQISALRLEGWGLTDGSLQSIRRFFERLPSHDQLMLEEVRLGVCSCGDSSAILTAEIEELATIFGRQQAPLKRLFISGGPRANMQCFLTQRWPHLQELSINQSMSVSFTNVHPKTAAAVTDLTVGSFDGTLTHFTSLQTLRLLHQQSHTPNLSSLSTSTAENLKKLHCEGASLTHLQPLLDRSPNLEDLKLTGTQIPASQIQPILRTIGRGHKLQRLTLGHINNFTKAEFIATLRAQAEEIQSLTYLSIDVMTTLDDLPDVLDDYRRKTRQPWGETNIHIRKQFEREGAQMIRDAGVLPPGCKFILTAPELATQIAEMYLGGLAHSDSD